jgi:hypothetical protein
MGNWNIFIKCNSDAQSYCELLCRLILNQPGDHLLVPVEDIDMQLFVLSWASWLAVDF